MVFLSIILKHFDNPTFDKITLSDVLEYMNKFGFFSLIDDTKKEPFREYDIEEVVINWLTIRSNLK